MIGSYEDMTHETHTIIFTNSRKRAIGFTPGVFQGVCFEVFISFRHDFGIIIKMKCSPFNQGIIQQFIMSINKVITSMTELSDPPSYIYIYVNALSLMLVSSGFPILIISTCFAWRPVSSIIKCINSTCVLNGMCQ